MSVWTCDECEDKCLIVIKEGKRYYGCLFYNDARPNWTKVR